MFIVVQRLFGIIRILGKYGLLSLLKDLHIFSVLPISLLSIIFYRRIDLKLSQAQRIRLALQELGPVFIKFGQMLSTRADLIGEELAIELSKLQDRVTSSIKEDVADIIKREFGEDVNHLFSKLDKTPVASASIAEVFKATTLGGEKVAVKILRPGIEDQFACDIKLFFSLVKVIDRGNKKLRRLKLKEVIEAFERISNAEMDLRFEAAAADELRDNHRGDKGVYIPKIYWNLVSQRIMTIEWVDGVSVYNLACLKHKKINLKKVVHNLLYMFLNQAYRDGFFHADLHPGNILIRPDGNVVLVDFGIMGRLDSNNKMYLAQILKGFIEKDYHEVARVHFRANYVANNKSIDDFAQACRAIGESIVGVEAHKISVSKLLTHLFKITEDFEMEVQPQLLLIQKTTVMIEGIISRLDPQINIWREAEPWVQEWAENNLKFDAKIMNKVSKLQDFVGSMHKQFILSMSRYPTSLDSGSNKSNYKLIVLLLIMIIMILLYKA